jgi:hypothetical protein
MSQAWVRNVEAEDLFEIFLVAAVSAVLGIRLFLRLTGYPQLGGDTLHIAHMLWGGLLMLAALVLLLGFLGAAQRRLAALLGGLGFGAFIDELGKYITADNDYFFQPAVALIYVTFVLLYIVFHALRPRQLTGTERVANALELLHEAVRHDLDAAERQHALRLLDETDPADPVANAVRQTIERMTPRPPAQPGRLTRARAAVRLGYQRLIGWRWFGRAMVVLAVSLATLTIAGTVNVLPHLSEVVLLAALSLIIAASLIRARQRLDRRRALLLAGALMLTLGVGAARAAIVQPPPLGFFAWAELISAAVPAVWLLAGIRDLAYSRIAAYRTFERAILFQIFVTQVFAFYSNQLSAVAGLFANVIILAALRTMIRQEEALLRERGISV